MKKAHLITIIAIASLCNAASGAARDKKGKFNPGALDTNGDGVISFAEFRENDKNGLSGLDLDKDGVLTLEEVLKSKPKAAKSGKSVGQENTRISQLFTKMDTDFDDTVTLAEFQDAKFDGMDLDSDGVLTKEELRPKPKRLGKMKPKNPDTNGDGVVSFVEFQESHKKGLSEQDIAKFNTMDVNSDGALSKEELDNSGIRSKEGLRPKRNNYQRKSQRRKRTQGRYTIGRQSRSNALRKEQ